MGTLVVLRGGAYQYMGYCHSEDYYGMGLKIANNPITVVDAKMLLGVIDNRKLMQYFIKNGFKVTDIFFKSILNNLDFLNGHEDFKRSEILMITVAGEIFIWSQGDLIQVEEDYMAIGQGSNIAMGCLYATSDLNTTPEARMKLALESIQKLAPSWCMSMGVERI